MKDPRPALDALGVQWEQVIDPHDGYDGTWTPECVYLHWTASAAGSDVSSHVVVINDYHACISRSGVAKLGGWQTKQAHGGSGRTEPIDIARRQQMTVDTLIAWQNSNNGDNTDSMPNRYGLAVAIDNNGVGEPVPPAQWDAFTATAAAFLDCLNRGPGALIDHSSSTNRKIDLATSPALQPSDWYPAIAAQLDRLHGGGGHKPRRRKMYTYLHDEDDQNWACDGMTVRWLTTPWAVLHWQADLANLGLPSTYWQVTRESLDAGEWGVITGPTP